MTLQELDRWEASFRDVHARFASLFARAESREQSAKYLRGLLAPEERRNGWQMAQAVGLADHVWSTREWLSFPAVQRS